MADFLPIYENMIRNEGGCKLHRVEGDRGGMTYAGIARNMNPGWHGWKDIDAGQIPDSELVRQFYREGYWHPIVGDEIRDQDIARTLFDFAVNSSRPGRPTVAIKLAQIVVGTTPDGAMGPKTLAAINAADPAYFKLAYSMAKVARYAEICNKDRGQVKFLLGWINRTLKEAA